MSIETAVATPVAIERLAAAIDDQIASLTLDLESERKRLHDEKVKMDLAIAEFRRIAERHSMLKTTPWWKLLAS